MNKNTYEDHLKYIKMIEQGYSIDYICKHGSISHKDLEVLSHRYQKDGPSGLVKKVHRLKDGKTREMILREIDAKCLTLHLAAAKYDVSVNKIIRWRRIAEEGGYEALYRGMSETYSAILMGTPHLQRLHPMPHTPRDVNPIAATLLTQHHIFYDSPIIIMSSHPNLASQHNKTLILRQATMNSYHSPWLYRIKKPMALILQRLMKNYSSCADGEMPSPVQKLGQEGHCR